MPPVGVALQGLRGKSRSWLASARDHQGLTNQFTNALFGKEGPADLHCDRLDDRRTHHIEMGGFEPPTAVLRGGAIGPVGFIKPERTLGRVPGVERCPDRGRPIGPGQRDVPSQHDHIALKFALADGRFLRNFRLNPSEEPLERRFLRQAKQRVGQRPCLFQVRFGGCRLTAKQAHQLALDLDERVGQIFVAAVGACGDLRINQADEGDLLSLALQQRRGFQRDEAAE